MTFRDNLVTITTGSAAVSAIVGNRVYPDVRNKEAGNPQLVYIAHVSDNDSDSRDHDGAGRTVSRVSFECWAETGRAAEELADALEQLWTGYQSRTYDIGRAFKANRLSDGYHQEMKLYRVILDYLIEHGSP